MCWKLVLWGWCSKIGAGEGAVLIVGFYLISWEGCLACKLFCWLLRFSLVCKV